MLVKSLGILYSYGCNFKCQHCSVNASPRLIPEVLPIDVLRKVIDDAYYVPSIRSIVFTGGEPTLHLKHLRFGIEYASRRGFVTRLVTNAWWARTYDRAKEFLSELRGLGLRELNISVDDFHMVFLRRFGGLGNVINAVRAALDLGLTVVIATAKVFGSEITTKYLREVFKDVEDKVYFQEDFVTPIGRAAALRPLVPHYKPTEIKGGCPHVGTLTIHPDGSVTICCGHAAMPNTDYGKFFVIGNVINEDLRVIINKFYRNALAWYLFVRGPQSLLARLNPDEEIANICDACYLLVTKYRDSLFKLSLRKGELFKVLLSNGDVGDLL